MAGSSILRYFLTRMLFSDAISFDPCIFHDSWGIKQKLKSGKITSFFSQVNLVFFSNQKLRLEQGSWHDMIIILMLKLWWLDLDLGISPRDHFKTWFSKFSNEILGSVNINFNRYRIFDAYLHYRFHHKPYDH